MFLSASQQLFVLVVFLALLSVNTFSGYSARQSGAAFILIAFHYLPMFILLTFVMLEK
jgi:hypothetical protein